MPMTGSPRRADGAAECKAPREQSAVSHGGTDPRSVDGADQRSAPHSLDPSVGPELTVTRRDLPHWQVGGSTYFITFRLLGTGPSRPADAPACPLQPPVLSREERQVVKSDILFWHRRRWHVHVLTVMPQHVHILASPREDSAGTWHSLTALLRGIKSGAARRINRIRGRRGSVWQPESYDRIVRSEDEFDEKAGYILGNAVKAGLVTDGWEYDGFWCEAQLPEVEGSERESG
jgi:putative transposase